MTTNSMNRDFCPRCGIKHLAQARALMKEVRKGYPYYVWYAIGHMAEAEDEIADYMPEEANHIREQRLEVERVLNDGAESADVYVPDFQKLMALVAQGAMLPETQYGDRPWNPMS